MAIEYSTLARECKTEIIVKKSKFITSVSPVNSERDAVAFVERIRKQYWDATHNVYGFVVGDNDEVARSATTESRREPPESRCSRP